MEELKNKEYEIKTIMAVLKDPSFAVDLIQLDPDCFSYKSARKAFKWIKKRHENDKGISLVKIKIDKEREINDRELDALTEYGPDPNNFYEILDELKRLRENRDKLNLKQKVNDLIDQGAGPEEIAEVVEAQKEIIEEEWPDPEPLSNYEEIEGIPLEIFNSCEWIKDFVEEVAASTQVPTGFVVMTALSVLSLAVTNKGEIEVRRGYKEALTLWTMSLLMSGERKTPVVNKFVSPIYEYEERINENEQVEIRHQLNEKKVLEDRVNRLQKQAGKAKDPQKRKKLVQEINDLTDELEEKTDKTLTNLLTTDTTPEKLIKIMAQNNGRQGIIDDEGGPLKNMGRRYSKSLNLDVYKKGYSGSTPIKEQRIGRDGSKVKKPALVMGLALQPGAFESWKDKEEAREEGIFGRALFCYPKSLVGYRKTGAQVPELSEIAEMRYKRGLHTLLNTKPAAVNEDGTWEPHIIKLSRNALEIRDQFAAEIEKRSRPEGDLYFIQDWANKLAGNMVRVAGIINLASQIDAEKKQRNPEMWDKPIPAAIMKRAVELGRKLIPHAKKSYNLLHLDPEIELAEYILKRIKEGKQKEQKNKLPKSKEKLDRSALYEMTRDKTEINKPQDLEEPLKLLEELNYIKLIERKGRLKPLIKLNPKVNTIDTISTIGKDESGKSGQDTEINSDISRVSF